MTSDNYKIPKRTGEERVAQLHQMLAELKSARSALSVLDDSADRLRSLIDDCIVEMERIIAERTES